MTILKLALLSCLTFSGAALPAYGAILVRVDQSAQRMSVDVDGQHLYEWRVSTGRPGYDTPNGDFQPNRMDADHYSKEYNNAPMPHAIFFDLHGDAIHGSYDPVGHPAASHGCVRLDPANAAKLFALVKEEGMANTKIEIGGDVTVALRASRQPYLVTVAEIIPGTTAQQIGLARGDVLLSYDGVKLTSKDQLIAMTDASGPGTHILVVRRGSKIASIKVPQGKIGAYL